MKKAQTEIMGLAIIILFIMLGLLFVFRLMNANPSDNLRTEYVDSKMASNVLTVILKTTLECKNLDVKSLYQDCAEGVNYLDYCGETNPCIKAKSIVEQILDNTLKKWERPYRFTATIGGTEKTLITNLGCNETNIGTRYRKLESKTYPIPTDVGTMLIKLDICR